MARLLTSGFELQTVTAGVEWGSVGSGTPTIDTTLKRTGAASLKILNSSATSTNIEVGIVAAGTYYVRVYVYLTTSVNTASNIFNVISTEGNALSGVSLNTDNTLQLIYRNASNTWVQTGSKSSAINDSAWHRVELYAKFNSTTSMDMALRLDGVTVQDTTTLTTKTVTTTTLAGLDLNLFEINYGNCTGQVNFDDVAVNDNSGSYQNSWPGSGKIIMLRPNAAGDSAQWLRAGTDSGANWSQCSQIPPDDATKYVRCSTVNYLDMYNCGNSGIGASDVVNVVEVGGRFNRSGATSPTFKFRCIKASAGTQALSAAITPSATAWVTNANAVPRTSPIILYLDPDNSVPWTQATLDTMQIGMVETTDQTAYVWVSEVWAIVDYTPSTTVTGGGAATVAPLTADGAGSHVTGTGAGTLSPTTASGIGNSVDGTGAATLSQVTSAGAGAHGVEGTAAATLASLISAGSASSVVGSGAGVLESLIAAGAGNSVSGIGVADLSPLVATGGGVHAVGAVGIASLDALSAVGEGAFVATGDGSGTLAPVVAIGEASHGVVGYGETILEPVTATGSGTVEAGEVEVTGTVAAYLSSVSANGEASHGVAGSGAAVLAQQVADGIALVAVSGAGAAQLLDLIAQGVGAAGVSGAGTAVVPMITAISTGTVFEGITGAGAAIAPALIADGYGLGKPWPLAIEVTIHARNTKISLSARVLLATINTQRLDIELSTRTLTATGSARELKLKAV